jgi:TolA-binding protein
MSRGRWTVVVAALLLGAAVPLLGKQPAASNDGAKKGGQPDHQMVERLLAARREYQECLEALRAHYIATGDIERARWAEDELMQFHRIGKQAYLLYLDVPPEKLEPKFNIPEANELYRRALAFKDRGYGTDYTDNQRRAELLFQQLLSRYPQSDKIDDAAYQLGDIYESKAYQQYQRAAAYFERCFQWNPKTHTDARIRAARLHERFNDRARALEIYKDVISHETDPKRLELANRRLAELGSPPR